MMVPAAFGFYGILSNPLRGYEYCTKLMVDHGVAFVQLRAKDTPKQAVIKTAEEMRRITAKSSTRFIVNDYPDIAALVGADGAHVGQDDMPYAQARKTVGANAIVGVSTHNLDQTRTACALGPDYVGIGPVFATPTKKIPDPPIGIDGMRAMLSAATAPAVVLGSITTENLPQILQAGARNFSMVRPINESREPESVLKEILRAYGAFAPA